MKKRFERAALICCVIVVFAFILLLMRRSSGSEENETASALSGYCVAEAANELSLPTVYIYEVEDEQSPYIEHVIPWRGEEIYPIVVDVPSWYLELPPLTTHIPEAVELPRPRKSPSDLQLALFAHMAFFPFDFNAEGRPDLSQFTTFHYRPFLNYVVPPGTNGKNQYGFSFAEEMEGWYLLQTYHNRTTDFSISFYVCAYGDTVILSIRGTDGNARISVLTQSGTWWCNFQTMAGVRHSHVGSLISILNDPATLAILEGTDIYITGHSLGGYLAYVAAYELAQMGFEDNIKRVVTFSAPIFSADTMEMISTLKPATRNRITHYYVSEDLIAGFVGVEMGSAIPTYNAFELTSQLFTTLRDVRGVDVPPAIYALSNLMIGVGNRLPFSLPDYMIELLWRLNGAMSADALAITNEFRNLVQHVPLVQTWHTPIVPPSRPADASLAYILRNYTPELIGEIVVDMVVRIFDADTHFMMNFYPHLVNR